MTALDEGSLRGRWVHSHEEDSDDEMVFRPATHPFPPSRGRTSFELREDGSYLERSPGPVDVPEETDGSWAVEGDRVVFSPSEEAPAHAWQVTSLEANRLVVRRPR